MISIHPHLVSYSCSHAFNWKVGNGIAIGAALAALGGIFYAYGAGAYYSIGFGGAGAALFLATFCYYCVKSCHTYQQVKKLQAALDANASDLITGHFLDCRDAHGNTPLHLAKSAEAIQVLAQKGADLEARNSGRLSDPLAQ